MATMATQLAPSSRVPEADVDAALAALDASLRAMRSLPSTDVGPAARRRLLAGTDRAVAALTVLRGQVLLAERTAGTWRGHGDPTFEAWRARTSRSGARPVLAQLRQAETAAELPRLGEAVRDGVVTPDHLEALSRVGAGAAPQVRAALGQADAQEELLSVARRVDAGTFGRAAARIAARLDPRGLERSHQAQRAARYLHVTDAADGTRISGLLDRMAGHRLRLALEAVTPRPAKDDERTSEQRRADALSTLAEAVLTDPRTTSGAAVRPHVSFHLTEATWVAIRAERARQERARERSEAGEAGEATTAPAAADPTTTEAVSMEPVTLDDGTPVPPSEVARALCDCELTRIVLDARGAPLDIGRAQRSYTGAQRRAVIARDRHCGWTDCTTHARWSEVHHIRWWDRDTGPTSVDNGILLCSYHHHEVHRLDLTIARDGPPEPGEPIRYRFTTPTGRVLGDGASP